MTWYDWECDTDKTEEGDDCGEDDNGGDENEDDDDKDGADEEEDGSEDEEEDEGDETEEEEKSRYAYRLVIMNYVQNLNVLNDKKFKESLKFICPFDYELIYDIMGLHSEYAKGRDIMIDDPILKRRVDHTMNGLLRLVKEGGKNKRYVQIFREDSMADMLRGVIGNFVREPTLIFRALVT